MLFQGKDGELRIHDFGTAGTTYRLSVLFSEMDFSGPTFRPRTEESLIMDRGNYDSNAHYIEGSDDPRYAPLPISFSCKIADTTNSKVLLEWVSGVTKLSGTTQLYSCKGRAAGEAITHKGIDTVTLPDFAEGWKSGNSGKFAYYVEVLWDGTNDLGLRYEEVYFMPGEQSLTESADGLTLNCNAQAYGDVTRITAFDANTTSVI